MSAVVLASRGRWPGLVLLLLALGLTACSAPGSRDTEELSLLNVSYDPTRELYDDFNRAFTLHWRATSGKSVRLQQSHGGSGKQARAVIDGLEADVVTLALAYDIDALCEKGKLIPPDWQKRLPSNSAPYSSTMVLVVRKGNPKRVHDWDDLVKPGISVLTPNPKTSGGARWTYLAAWAHALSKPGGNEASARKFVAELYANVPVLDSGARGSTTSFVQRGLADVLITWENEAFLLVAEQGPDKYEIVVPPRSILAEPPVALVDTYVDKHGTRALAQAYLEYLYSKEGQDIAAKHYYRPRDPEVAARYAGRFAKVELFTLQEVFGSWKQVQRIHFDDGGTFDQCCQVRH